MRSLEGQLQIMHYDLSRPDTIFGPQTARAVVAFQKVNGMRRTGIVTAEVWQRMFYAPKLPRLRYIRSGRGVEVNLSKQVMLRAKHGRLVRIYDVSTGRSSLPTPVSGGAPFHIWRRKLWGLTGWTDSSGTRHHYVNYFKRGTLLAIHAYAYVPPYPASDGCIRVPPGSARRLWWTLHLRERVYTYN